MIIPNWNGAHLLGTCLDSLRTQTYPRLEIVVADGASHDGSVDLVARSFPEARLVRLPRNYGFAGNVNAGLRAAQGEILALLNNDAEAESAWIEALVTALAAEPAAGAAASKMLHFDDRRTIASAGDVLRRDGLAAQRGNGEADDGRFDTACDVFAASGGAAAYRREMLNDVGLFDECYVSYLEDVDLGLRARLRGWRCRYVPTARVYHRVSATGGGPLASYFVARNSIRLVAKCFPLSIVRDSWSRLLIAQLSRAQAAVRAWRGAAARASLRGQAAGLRNLPAALHARRAIMARRTMSDADFLELLES